MYVTSHHKVGLFFSLLLIYETEKINISKYIFFNWRQPPPPPPPSPHHHCLHKKVWMSVCLSVCLCGVGSQTVGPIVTKPWEYLEGPPGQVLGNQKWHHSTESDVMWPGIGWNPPFSPFRETKLATEGRGTVWQGWNLAQTQNATWGFQWGNRKCSPNRKWPHQTGSEAVLGPRKLRSPRNLVYDPNITCRGHWWCRLQPEVKFKNRKWPHQTGSGVFYAPGSSNWHETWYVTKISSVEQSDGDGDM